MHKDERAITDPIVDQIKFADIIIVNEIDMVDSATKAWVLGPIKKTNPVAKVIEAKYSEIDVKEIIDMSMVSFEKAATKAR